MHTVLATRLGKLTVIRDECGLTGLYFPRHWPRPDRTSFGPPADEGFEDVARQLGEYLAGDRTGFELSVTVTAPSAFGSGWYDVSVTSDDPQYLRRLAGHVETREPSVSDPSLGFS